MNVTYEQAEKDVRAELKRCFDKAAQLWPAKSFKFPTVIMNGIQGSVAGRAFIRENTIKFNYTLMMQNYEGFIKRTVCHEAGHLICHAVYGFGVSAHGPEWKGVMVNIGGSPTRCHQYNTARNKAGGSFDYKCKCAGGTKLHHYSLVHHSRFQQVPG